MSQICPIGSAHSLTTASKKGPKSVDGGFCCFYLVPGIIADVVVLIPLEQIVGRHLVAAY